MHSPPVHCPFTRLADPTKLKPHPRNANHHPTEQLASYSKIITRWGWRRAITISGRTGHIIRGHGALQVALAAGWDKVPIEVQEYADDQAELTDLLADNQLARYATTDREALAAVCAELVAQGIDLELAGIVPTGPGGEVAGSTLPAPVPQILIICTSETQQAQLLKTFTEEGMSVRAQIS